MPAAASHFSMITTGESVVDGSGQWQGTVAADGFVHTGSNWVYSGMSTADTVRGAAAVATMENSIATATRRRRDGAALFIGPP